MDSTLPPGSGDNQENHAIERSITLAPGAYDFQVSLRVINFHGGESTFQLSNWHFAVEAFPQEP